MDPYRISTMDGTYSDTLLECKMFKKEKDEMAIASELDNSLVQIEEHIDSLIRDKVQLKYVYLLLNRYENPKKIVNNLTGKFRNIFSKYKLRVFSPQNIEELIAKLMTSRTLVMLFLCAYHEI